MTDRDYIVKMLSCIIPDIDLAFIDSKEKREEVHNRIIDKATEIYQRLFKSKEIKEIATFLTTPTGKKFSAVRDAMSDEFVKGILPILCEEEKDE